LCVALGFLFFRGRYPLIEGAKDSILSLFRSIGGENEANQVSSAAIAQLPPICHEAQSGFPRLLIDHAAGVLLGANYREPCKNDQENSNGPSPHKISLPNKAEARLFSCLKPVGLGPDDQFYLIQGWPD